MWPWVSSALPEWGGVSCFMPGVTEGASVGNVCMHACVRAYVWCVDEVVRDGMNTCCPVSQCTACLGICT